MDIKISIKKDDETLEFDNKKDKIIIVTESKENAKGCIIVLDVNTRFDIYATCLLFENLSKHIGVDKLAGEVVNYMMQSGYIDKLRARRSKKIKKEFKQ